MKFPRSLVHAVPLRSPRRLLLHTDGRSRSLGAILSPPATRGAGSIQVDPSRYHWQGTLRVPVGKTLLFETDAALVRAQHDFYSPDIVHDDAGTAYRVFCYESIEIESGATICVTGTTPALLVSRLDVAPVTPILLDGNGSASGNHGGVDRSGGEEREVATAGRRSGGGTPGVIHLLHCGQPPLLFSPPCGVGSGIGGCRFQRIPAGEFTRDEVQAPGGSRPCVRP